MVPPVIKNNMHKSHKIIYYTKSKITKKSRD